MTRTFVDEIDEQILSPTFVRDPFPVYHRLRGSQPVYRSDALQQWLVTGRDEVMSILRDLDRFSNFGWELARIQRLTEDQRERLPNLTAMCSTPVIVFSDPPEHTRLRGFAAKTFTPRALTSSREWMEQISEELVDRMLEQARFDLVDGLAFPLPLRSIIELFGARAEDAERYKKLSRARLLFQGTPIPDFEIALHLEEQLVSFRRYLNDLCDKLRARPDGRLLSTLLEPNADGDQLDADEFFHMCVVFLSAGHETTTALISTTLLALLQDREQLRLVIEEPEKLNAAVQECLRWATPVQRILRIAREDVELSGQTIRKGDVVVLVLAAVNRDPSRFPEPDRFDLERSRAGHVAFGNGPHVCIGANLGRMEATTAIGALLRRAPDLRLEGNWEPDWAKSISVRTLNSLRAVRGS